MTVVRYLVISAGGHVRVVVNQPTLALDEFCYRLTVEIPATWGSILGEIRLRLPDPEPSVTLDQEEPEEPIEEIEP